MLEKLRTLGDKSGSILTTKTALHFSRPITARVLTEQFKYAKVRYTILDKSGILILMTNENEILLLGFRFHTPSPTSRKDELVELACQKKLHKI